MRSVVLPLLCSLLASPVSAGGSCAGLQDGDASLGRADGKCQQSRLSGGSRQATCHWAFPYRSEAARAGLQDVRRIVEACLGPDAALPGDTQVNHPDSYILLRYEGQGVQVALSLKDKGALQQTFLFVRLHALP